MPRPTTARPLPDPRPFVDLRDVLDKFIARPGGDLLDALSARLRNALDQCDRVGPPEHRHAGDDDREPPVHRYCGRRER